MATIERKKNGSYLIRCSGGYDSHGKQIRHSMTWTPDPGMTQKKIEKELQRQATLFEETCKTQGLANGGKTRVRDFSERWLEEYVKPNLKQRTYESYRDNLKLINDSIGHIRLESLRPYDLQKFYNELRKPYFISKCFPVVAMKKIFSEAGLKTQPEISQALGISINYVKKLYKGDFVPEPVAKSICKRLSIDLRSIFNKIDEEHHHAEKSIKNLHLIISSMLETAVQWELISSNPAGKIRKWKSDAKDPVYLDDVQANNMLAALISEEDLEFRTMIELLLFSGMRRGELLGLQWTDIDFDRNQIFIQRALLHSRSAGTFVSSTKTKSSCRVITVSDSMVGLLRSWKSEQSRQALRLGSTWQRDNWVFTNATGNWYSPDTLSTKFRRFIDRNELPPIHLHSLRHTNATLMIAAGTNIQTVAARLGHSSSDTTSKVYAHAIESADRRAADELERLLHMA